MTPDAGILTAQGGVDKAALLAAMRDNPGLRREVEHLVHGLVRAAVEEFWNAAEAAAMPWPWPKCRCILKAAGRTSFLPHLWW